MARRRTEAVAQMELEEGGARTSAHAAGGARRRGGRVGAIGKGTQAVAQMEYGEGLVGTGPCAAGDA